MSHWSRACTIPSAMGEKDTLHARWLAQGSMNGWHALAAILTVASMQGATHRIAAPHRLLRRSHSDAIERIARQSHAEYSNQHPSSKAHSNQTRGSPCVSQDRVVTERAARARESRAHHVVECGRYRQRDPGQGFETSFIACSATSATVCSRQLPRNSIKSARPIRCSCCA